ncbi:hypothetical protein ESCO_001581 [Escovopsis weberi]|uniref:Uncharacterized protein n=1 Tax=Escovopsis weberi TaxID=150374 RepID=A0A0M8N7Y7_ESCWE|nr:hypothetical protein ESCO_001581 [Escovopsis weberi]
MASQSWTRQQKIKSGIWAAAFAAVIFVGTLTGAQLKTDKQREEAIQEFRAVRPADQIVMLEARKALLLEQRRVMQKKLDVFREGLRDKELERASATKKP